MNSLLVLPVIIPLLFAAFSLIAWGKVEIQKGLALIGTGLLLLCSLLLLSEIRTLGVSAVQFGSWEAPFGITFVADLLSAIMVVLCGLTGFSVCLYSIFFLDEERPKYGFYPLFLILLMGVNGSFLTGDIFNLYVWFEVMLMSSFVLLSLGGERPQLEGAVKYLALNFLASALFLAAAGLLYGYIGSLNMADIATKLNASEDLPMVTMIGMMFLISFGIKAGIFPLFFWLPASYHTPPVPVSAVFAGLLTKVGVYAMIRVFTLIFIHDDGTTHALITGLALLTMITGVLGAAAQFDIRRILSFHIVSQIGYMILGLGLFTPLALAGSIFYLMHHIIVKTNLFLIGGVIQKIFGTEDLAKLGGLYKSRPVLAVLFLIPAMSLAGLPPLSGFFAKLFIILAALEIHAYLAVGVALTVGALTLFSMTKIWNEAFWKDPPEPPQPKVDAATLRGLYSPIVLLAILTVLIGLSAGPMFSLAHEAAQQLMNPTDYLEAVLGS